MGQRARMHLIRGVAVVVTPTVALAVYLTLHPLGDKGSSCFAQSNKRCGCPIAPDEAILIPCKSVYPDQCGACSVTMANRQREGRPCLTLQ